MPGFPPDVSAVRQFLPDGAVEYKLSHPEVGEMGRMIVIPSQDGQTEIRHEVFSGRNDGLYSRRQELWQPSSVPSRERSVAMASFGNDFRGLTMTPEIASAIKTILATLPDGAELRFYWQDGAQYLHIQTPGQPDQVAKLNRIADGTGVIVPAQLH